MARVVEEDRGGRGSLNWDPAHVAEVPPVDVSQLPGYQAHLDQFIKPDDSFVSGLVDYAGWAASSPIASIAKFAIPALAVFEGAPMAFWDDLGSGWGDNIPDDTGGDFGGFDPGGDFGLPSDQTQLPQLPDFGGGGTLQRVARLINDSGDVVGGTTRTGITSAVTGGLVSGGIWLGSYLAKALGRTAGGAIYTAANGIRVRIAQLWPLVRKYGAENVAGALGIGIGALGTLLMQPGARAGTRRGRRRGISARDVKTTRRTIGQLRSLSRMAGLHCGPGRARARPRRYYQPRYYR